MNNVFVSAIINEENRCNNLRKNSEWGVRERNRLVEVLQNAGANISEWMWDALLFNINALRINKYGQVCYMSYFPPSKKILSLLSRYNQVIVENFKYITRV